MSEASSSEDALAGPDKVAPTSPTPPTEVEGSDPNADSAEGLAGDMGVSSERKGPARGRDEEVTYAAAPTPFDDAPAEDEAPPEQSASEGRPEVNPDSPGAHQSDPGANPGHGV
jgi:hypothetical protein